MAGPTTPADRTAGANVPAHRALLELDLAAWAGRRVAAGGRRDALLGRVEALHLSLDGRTIEARVRGSRPHPHQVQILVQELAPHSSCTCAPEPSGPCRHAVAALEALRFPTPTGPRRVPRRSGVRRGAGYGKVIRPARAVAGFVILGNAERTRLRADRIAAVREQELSDRREAARREHSPVTIVPAAGRPRYEVGRGGPIVTFHGEGPELGSCTCEDYASNELGTCKHVERVRGWLQRQRKTRRPRAAGSVLSVWWSPRSWIDLPPDALAEIRVSAPGGLHPELHADFEENSYLRAGAPGLSRAESARAAIARARALASVRGWVWDLDPAVERGITEADEAERLHRKRAASVASKTWDTVQGELRLTLHPYQETGVRFLASVGRAFLADDMGLGKTVQAVMAALLLRRSSGAARALVVCPASLKHQWRSEIAKICGEQAQVVDGPPLVRRAGYRRWREGFLILNYELVLRDLAEIRAAAPHLVILDEAQRIKNWSAKTAQAVKRLSSPHAFVLTGTPLENRLQELHSLVEFLHPRASGPRWRLLPFHAVTDRQGQIVAYEGLDVLRRRLDGFFLRRERATVLDQLPPRTDNTFWTGMSAAQRPAYRKLAALAARLLSRGRLLNAPEVGRLLRALTGMRMLCNALAQYDWDGHERVLKDATGPGIADVRALGSPKLEEFARVLEELLDESQEKIVVFSQWERMLRLAHYVSRPLLEPRELRAEVFHGGLSGRSRGRMLEAFRLEPEFRVLFWTDAGGLGLNLQEAASIVVNLEVPWNPAVLEQRVGRVHRLGQRRSVQVLHFVTAGAIEERVRQVVENKRALFQGLFVGDSDTIELTEREAASTVERLRGLLETEFSGAQL